MTNDETQAVNPATERPEVMRGLGRRLIIPALLGVAAFLMLALVSDLGDLTQRLGEFDTRLLIPVLSLSLLNYLLRFVRWEFYLRRLGVTLDRTSSVAIFLVGFALSVTPGKAGELGKAWLAREMGGGAARRTVAVVLCERVTDLLGVILLTSLTCLAFAGGAVPAFAGLFLSAIAVAIISWPRLAEGVLHLGERLPWIGPRIHLVEEVWDRLRDLLTPWPLVVGLLTSVAAWGAEGIGFYIVVRNYAPDIAWTAGLFTYAFSTLLGAVSMLPGGLLATEGALAALLDYQGLETAVAASATVWIRVATLWFAVLLGLLAVPIVYRRLRRFRADGSSQNLPAQGKGAM